MVNVLISLVFRYSNLQEFSTTSSSSQSTNQPHQILTIKPYCSVASSQSLLSCSTTSARFERGLLKIIKLSNAQSVLYAVFFQSIKCSRLTAGPRCSSRVRPKINTIHKGLLVKQLNSIIHQWHSGCNVRFISTYRSLLLCLPYLMRGRSL